MAKSKQLKKSVASVTAVWATYFMGFVAATPHSKAVHVGNELCIEGGLYSGLDEEASDVGVGIGVDIHQYDGIEAFVFAEVLHLEFDGCHDADAANVDVVDCVTVAVLGLRSYATGFHVVEKALSGRERCCADVGDRVLSFLLDTSDHRS